ncbi:transposase [Thiocapsa sp.]|uniref:transposase n=1 Tax=Thiocapsa sp. TaxID=2024551 RepID=UPI00345A2540
MEGLNNKLKVIKRRCYGMTSLKHFYQRVYLDLNGYAKFRNRSLIKQALARSSAQPFSGFLVYGEMRHKCLF